MLVFAFVPTLAALPRWLYFETTNRLNLEDPVVLVFIPIRGIVLLLTAFRDGVVQGLIAGLIDGVLMAFWLLRWGHVASLTRRIIWGALCGAVAAIGMVLLGAAVGIFESAQLIARPAAVGFEIGSGIVCGMIAAVTASRLWLRSVGPEQPG